MTGPQADWLRKNRAYRAVAGGHVPSGYTYKSRGMLHEDGTMDLQIGAARPPIRPGSFEVGILIETQNLERR